MDKKKVILVTDGDKVAQRAVEIAAKNIGGRCISASAGNPTILTGNQIVELVNKAEHGPVVVMVDDRGKQGEGRGERAMKSIIDSSSVSVLGVVAVSFNGKDCNGLKVDCSVTSDGQVVDAAVDKYGRYIGQETICGDTLSVLKGMHGLTVVGIGDPGKMDFKDDISKGAPITTKALKEVLKRSGGS